MSVVDCQIKDGFALLKVRLNDKPVVSKSAIAKATAKGDDPSKIEPTVMASSGGFTNVGNGLKVSLNIIKA